MFRSNLFPQGFLLLFPLLFLFDGALTLPEEHRLHGDLLNSYNKFVRPALNISDTTMISLGLAAISIVELNPKDEIIILNGWMRFSWKDPLLVWDPKEYAGIAHTRIPWNQIWRPDITLYNAAEPMNPTEPAFSDTMAVIQYDGSVLFIPHVFLKAKCRFDMRYFPGDTQMCHFKFGSWTFDGYKMDVSFFDGKADFDLADYVSHSEWTVLKTSATKNVKKYPCCSEPYPDITFAITVKRRGQYLYYLGPAIILGFMIPLIFLVPYGTGDKTTLGFCIQLGLLFLLSSMEDNFLYTTMPLLAAYYVISFILVGVSLCITILLNVIFGGCKMVPPNAVLKLFNALGSILCVSGTSDKKDAFALVDSEGTTSPSTTAGNGRAKWLFIATVCDRIMFVVFLLIVAIITGAVIGKL